MNPETRFILLILVALIPCNCLLAQIAGDRYSRHRVIITTDINNAGGDPDDKQSMAHVLWYANELEIVGIIPDYWTGDGVEATLEAVAAYERDYTADGSRLNRLSYPSSSHIRDLVARTPEAAVRRIIEEAHRPDPRPLYVLVWGQMNTLRDALFTDQTIAGKLRVLTIATNVKYQPDGDCDAVNWNGGGRHDIFNDPRFVDLWWLESDWTYNGMFEGPEPKQMLEELSQAGALGSYISYVVAGIDWAQYFRVGDTPTVLYLIDPGNDYDDPSKGSWAGRFTRPLPETRPNYWTGVDGGRQWDYGDPCSTWENAEAVYDARINTLLEHRPELYEALLDKLDGLYE